MGAWLVVQRSQSQCRNQNSSNETMAGCSRSSRGQVTPERSKAKKHKSKIQTVTPVLLSKRRPGRGQYMEKTILVPSCSMVHHERTESWVPWTFSVAFGRITRTRIQGVDTHAVQCYYGEAGKRASVGRTLRTLTLLSTRSVCPPVRSGGQTGDHKILWSTNYGHAMLVAGMACNDDDNNNIHFAFQRQQQQQPTTTSSINQERATTIVLPQKKKKNDRYLFNQNKRP